LLTAALLIAVFRTPRTAVASFVRRLWAGSRERPTGRDGVAAALAARVPGMDGLTFLRQIMATTPIPTVIGSTLTTKGSEIALGAIDEILPLSAIPAAIQRFDQRG
jgi:hypothetical protein